MANHFAQQDFTLGGVPVKLNQDLSELPFNQLADFKLVGLAGPEVVDDEQPVDALDQDEEGGADEIQTEG